MTADERRKAAHAGAVPRSQSLAALCHGRVIGIDASNLLYQYGLRSAMRLYGAGADADSATSSPSSSNTGGGSSGSAAGIGAASAALAEVVGAGGGGFLMFYTRDRTQLRSAMAQEGLVEVDFHFDFDGSTTIVRG